MKFSLVTPALVAILGLAFSGPLLTAQAQSTNAAPASTAGADTPFKGKVTAVDTSANTVTVKSKSGEVVLSVTSSTTFKKAKSLSDIAVGDHVTGSYTADGAKNNATEISKSGAKTKKKKSGGDDSGSGTDAGGGGGGE